MQFWSNRTKNCKNGEILIKKTQKESFSLTFKGKDTNMAWDVVLEFGFEIYMAFVIFVL